jgi:hypothetical protein
MGAAAAADTEDGFGFVDEEEGEVPFSGAFAALGEEIADLSFGFADPHIEDFGAFDVEEELGSIDAGGLTDLFAEVPGGGFAEEGFAATGGAMEEEAFGDGMIEPLEEIAVEEGEFDGIADGLEGFVLSADIGPGEWGDGFEGAVGSVRLAEDFEGDALGGVEAEFEAGFEFFLGQEGGALDDHGQDAGVMTETEAPIGEDVVESGDGTAVIEAERADDGEGFIAEDALAYLEGSGGYLGIDLADVIGAAEADLGEIGVDGAEVGADAESGSAEFFEGMIELFEGLAGLVVGFLQAADAGAQVNQFGGGGVGGRIVAGDQIQDLEGGTGIEEIG